MRQKSKKTFHQLLTATALLLGLFAFAGFTKESRSILRPQYAESLFSYPAEKKTVAYSNLKIPHGSLNLFCDYHTLTKIIDFSQHIFLIEKASNEKRTEFFNFISHIRFIILPQAEEATYLFSRYKE